MTRSTRKVPIQKSKPKSARKIRRSFHHALRQATNRAIEKDRVSEYSTHVMLIMKEVSDTYSICDSEWRGFKHPEDREKIKRK